MSSWTVTVYRKGAAIIVSYSTSVATQVYQGAAGFQTQVEGLVSDIYLGGLTLAPVSYDYTYKLGFQRNLDYVMFSGDTAQRYGGGIHSHKPQQFMPPSTAWLAFSTTDTGAMLTLPAQMKSCDCTAVTAMDLDNDQYQLYNVARTTDAPVPDNVPATDLALVVSNDKFNIVEWYDPASLVPDAIIVRKTLLKLKRDVPTPTPSPTPAPSPTP